MQLSRLFGYERDSSGGQYEDTVRTAAVVRHSFWSILVMLLLITGMSYSSWAEETPTGNAILAQPAVAPTETQATPAPVDPLHVKQLSLASRFKRFEDTMRKIADYTKKTDPERAELLYRAIGKSQGSQVPLQMELVVKLLEKQSYGDAQLRQEDLINELYLILQILQSEDEKDRLKKEIARVEDLIKDVNKVIGEQKDVRAETERGGKFKDVEKKQSDVARNADRLGKKIDAQDAEKQAKQDANKNSSPNKDGAGKSQDGKEQKPGNEDPKDQEKPASENKDDKKDDEKSPSKEPGKEQSSKPSEGKQSESKPSEGKPSEGKPSEGEPSESPPPQSQDKKPPQGDENQSEDDPQQQEQKAKTPGREEIEQAHKKMEQAIEELKKQSRTEASNKQDKAIAELEKAKAKLEELLRQLREEERELKLAALEARFRRMLEMQVRVRQSTFTLSQTAEAERAARHAQRATQLSRDENEITLEADKALLMMREDGGSIAFPEAVEQMKEDMNRVTNRLLEVKLDKLTVAIEDDIIESLKEMIEALQKEQEEIKQSKQKRQQGQEPQDPELTNKLAELKMLRSLQNRINRRTRQYGEQIDGEQAVDPELVSLLKELSVRQARVQAATYAMAKGKNK